MALRALSGLPGFIASIDLDKKKRSLSFPKMQSLYLTVNVIPKASVALEMVPL